MYGNANGGERSRGQAKYNYRRGNYTDMSEALRQVDWVNTLRDMDVEETWNCVKGKLKTLVEEYVPKMKTGEKKKFKAPWWHGGIEQEVKMKHKAWKEYTEAKNTENWKRYVTQRNKTTSMIRKARRDYENRLTDNLKQAPKKLYAYIRAQQKVKAAVGPLMTVNNQLTETEEETAEVLQSFFKSVFTKESGLDVPEFPEQLNEDQEMPGFEITEEEVSRELRSLNPDKASGPDGVQNTVLKECAKHLAKPLCILFNKSMENGQLPLDWKRAIITPIFKKGTRSNAANYRPVSLTSQVCKVMERILKVHIVEHLETHNVISEQQHGFTKGRSCQTNLLESLEDWTDILDEGKGLDIIYLDYKKAFDTVPHRRLFHKLSAYGLKGNILRWLEDFLRARQQQVRVGNGHSSWASVTSGVPQGSVLGPVLFLIYVNEIPGLVHSRVKMFADDMKMYRVISSSSDSQLLQQDVDVLSEWSRSWLLKFNVSKCKVMHCGASNPRMTYHMTQDSTPEPLEETCQETDLGVTVDNTLKPTHHCNKASSRGMFALKQLKVTFGTISSNNFKPLYNAFVRPHIEYCAQAVGPYMVQNFKSLGKVQRRATKLVQGMRNVPYEERLSRLGMTSVEERLQRGDLIMTYKMLTGKVKLDPEHFFERSQEERTRGHHLRLTKKRARLHARGNFFSHRVVSPWNALPEEVVSAATTNCFKNRLDHWTTRNVQQS